MADLDKDYLIESLARLFTVLLYVCLELQITMSSTDCLVTMMPDLVKDYLMKICTLLPRLFTVLIVSTLSLSS